MQRKNSVDHHADEEGAPRKVSIIKTPRTFVLFTRSAARAENGRCGEDRRDDAPEKLAAPSRDAAPRFGGARVRAILRPPCRVFFYIFFLGPSDVGGVCERRGKKPPRTWAADAGSGAARLLFSFFFSRQRVDEWHQKGEPLPGPELKKKKKKKKKRKKKKKKKKRKSKMAASVVLQTIIMMGQLSPDYSWGDCSLKQAALVQKMHL